MRRLLMMLGVMALLAGAAGTASPVQAAEVVATGPCADLDVRESFSPRLNLTASSGTVTKRANNRLCAQTTVSTSPPGVSAQVINASHGNVSYPYVGNCVLATYSFGGGLGVIVGGTVDVFTSVNPTGVSALALVPNPPTDVCNVSSARGAGAIAFADVS